MRKKWIKKDTIEFIVSLTVSIAVSVATVLAMWSTGLLRR